VVRKCAVRHGLNEADVITSAAAVEKNSRHPLALAVVAAASGSLPDVDDDSFRQEPGAGAVGVVRGKKVAVGTLQFVTGGDTGSVPPEIATAASSSSPGRTPVFVSIDGRVAGVLEMEDEVRPDAASAIARLQKRGLRTVLLSGDRQETAESVGTSLGIAKGDIYGDVKPEGKAQLVEKLQSQGASVAMVGDGINDAAALAQADVGVAMAGGVGAASEVASIVLLGDSPSQVVDSIELSKATFAKIKQNLGWAFAYNAVGIPIAAGVLLPFTGLALTPSVAGGLMGFSSIGVMANSLLLQLTGKKLSKMPEPREDQDGDDDNV
jgi:Cu2+-exporting ATPase